MVFFREMLERGLKAWPWLVVPDTTGEFAATASVVALTAHYSEVAEASRNEPTALGTHSMGKTHGYFMRKGSFQADMCIEEISKALGQSYTAVTKAYVGLDPDPVRRSILEFEFVSRQSAVLAIIEASEREQTKPLALLNA